MGGGCLVPNLSFLLFSTLFIKTFSQLRDYPNAIDAKGSACTLNFTQNPYQPTGQCINNRIRDKLWGSFTTSFCCANALTTISKALALRITKTSTGQTPNFIFLPQDQWASCNGNFYRQPSVSVDSCQFDKLYAGSGAACSKLYTSNITTWSSCNNIITACSDFQTLPYETACEQCTKEITQCRNQLLSDLVPEANDTKSEVCSLAIIVLVAADKLQNDPSSFNDFYNCLPVLDEFDPGYIRINYSYLTTTLSVLLVVLGVVLVIVLVKYVSKSQARSQALHKEDPAWSGLYRFTKVEIENAINFWGETDRRYLGRGSAGLVYMGVLPSGQNVAIKHIFKTNNSNSFFSEVAGLSRIRHSNLVCLFGYCVEDNEQYLVYEYCSGGNLSQRLLRKDTILSWYDRVKILRHCALALRFLHNNLDGCIVHRDIKLTNILLSDDLVPKLSDFGLAKLLKMEQSKVFTDVRGTIGYMDPEYMTNAKLTCASDIYSFGIVTLQLLSGQRVIELNLDARDQLTRKARDVSMERRPLAEFIDPKLNGEVDETDFESILQIAVLCVAKSSKGRPSINVVFDEMNKAWKNAEAAKEKKDKLYQHSDAMSESRSMEVIAV